MRKYAFQVHLFNLSQADKKQAYRDFCLYGKASNQIGASSSFEISST